MAAGVKGSYEIVGTKNITGKVFYEETYDALSNTSTVMVTGLQFKSSNWNGFEYYLSGTVRINGTVVASANSAIPNLAVYIRAKNEYFSVSRSLAGKLPWTVNSIPHNVDGSKSIDIQVDLSGWNDSAGNTGWVVSGTKTIALTTIPRASEIEATPADIGTASIIKVSRKSTAYTYSIQYFFGSLSGYVTQGGVSPTEVRLTDASISWPVPTEFYSQIPNSKTGVCTLKCRTWSGGTRIGEEKTAQLTVTAREEWCRPDVSGTVTDGNSDTSNLTGNPDVLVRYMSTAVCIISASAKNGATIAAKSIGGVGIAPNENTRYIPAVETGSFSFYAADSRGYYRTPDPVQKTLIPYVKLTNNASATRNGSVMGDARLSLSGDYFSGSFGAVDNALTAQYRVNGGAWVPVTPNITGNSYSLTVSLSGLDYKTSYNIEVSVSDRLSTVHKSVILEAAVPTFDWGKDYFRFHVPVLGMSRIYAANGKLMDSPDGVFQAVGKAQVWIIGDMARIDFNCVVTASDGQVAFGYGLNPKALRAVNPEIPVITPVGEGLCRFYDASGNERWDITQYAGAISAHSGVYWEPCRIYTVNEAGVGNRGADACWARNMFAAGTRLIGSCYGIVTY